MIAATTTEHEHRIVILDDYQQASTTYADWSSLSHIPVTTLTTAIPSSSLVSTLLPYTIIHAMRERTKFSRLVLSQLPNLRFISTTGGRNRGIDLDAARELGIPVSGTIANGNASGGTVEQTWALILALSRRLLVEDRSMREGGWQTGVATGLTGKRLGVIGVGRLGKVVASVGKAFGMEVVGWSPHLDEKRAEEAGLRLAGSLEELMRISDVVSLHMVSSAATRGLLGREELGWMKETAFLVNTSRGPLVDTEALLETLRDRRIRGAGLDVYDEEPLPADHPLRSLDNVVLSPHMGASFPSLACSFLTLLFCAGYVDDTSYTAWWPQTVANIEGFLAGSPLRLLNSDPASSVH